MANISELLANSSPEALQQLLDLHNSLGGGSSSWDAQNSSSLPKVATSDPSRAADLNEVLGKQATQDLVNSQSIPGKTAADSAKVFQNAPGSAAEQAESNMAQAAKSALGDATPGAEDALASAAPEVAGSALGGLAKLAGPLGALTGLYGGTTAAAELDDVPGAGQTKGVGPASTNSNANWTGSTGHTSPPTGEVMGPPSSLATPPSDDSDADDSTQSSKAKTPAIGALLAQMQARQPSQDPQGYGSNLNAQALAKAQQNSALLNGIAQFGKASDTIGAAFSRGAYKADPSFYNDFEKTTAQAPVNNILQQRQAADAATAHQMEQYKLADEKEKNDPNSSASALARNVLTSSAAAAKLNLGDISKLSASTIEKTFPSVAKLIDTQSQNNQRAEAAKDRMAMMGANAGNKQEKTDETIRANLVKALDPNGPRAGNFGQAGKMKQAVDRINAILKQFPDGKVPKAQTEELATASAALVGGGTAQSQQQIHSVVPQSLMGDASSYYGYLMNHPEVLHQPEFIKNLADSANREGAVAQQQIKEIQAQRLAGLQGYANRNPEVFNSVLQGAGLDPSNYDMKAGLYKAPKQQAGRTTQSVGGFSPAQESGIQAVMSGNNVDRDTAVAALKKAGKI